MADPYHRALLPQVLEDLRAAAEFDDRLVDLAERRKTGKRLGARHVSGDLEGCRRLRFDLPGERPERFRIIYRLRPDEASADTVEVIAVGPRGGHAAYRSRSPGLRTAEDAARSAGSAVHAFRSSVDRDGECSVSAVRPAPDAPAGGLDRLPLCGCRALDGWPIR